VKKKKNATVFQAQPTNHHSNGTAQTVGVVGVVGAERQEPDVNDGFGTQLGAPNKSHKCAREYHHLVCIFSPTRHGSLVAI